MKTKWIHVGIVVGVLFLILLPAVALAQSKNTVRVFVPVHPSVQETIQHRLGEALPHVDIQVDGPQLQWGVQLETVQPGQLAQRVREGQYDVIVLRGTTTYMASQGLLMALDPFVQRTGFTNERLPSMHIDGKLYDVPLLGEQLVVMYNRHLFNQHGLPYPHAGWTWGDFAHAAVAASEHKPNGESVYGAVLPPNNLLQYILYQNSTDMRYVTDEELTYALSVANQLAAGRALLLDSYGTDMQFSQGNAAMQVVPLSIAFIQSQWPGRFRDNVSWGVAPLPHTPGAPAVNLNDATTTVALAQGAMHPGAAWEVAALLAREGHELLGGAFDVPAYMSADEMLTWLDSRLPDLDNVTREELYALLNRPNIVFSRDSHGTNATMNQALGEQLGFILAGMTTPEQALAQLKQVRDRLQ